MASRRYRTVLAREPSHTKGRMGWRPSQLVLGLTLAAAALVLVASVIAKLVAADGTTVN